MGDGRRLSPSLARGGRRRGTQPAVVGAPYGIPARQCRPRSRTLSCSRTPATPTRRWPWPTPPPRAPATAPRPPPRRSSRSGSPGPTPRPGMCGGRSGLWARPTGCSATGARRTTRYGSTGSPGTRWTSWRGAARRSSSDPSGQRRSCGRCSPATTRPTPASRPCTPAGSRRPTCSCARWRRRRPSPPAPCSCRRGSIRRGGGIASRSCGSELQQHQDVRAVRDFEDLYRQVAA